MVDLIRRFIRDERGATAVEYGLLAALVSLAAGSVVAILGDMRIFEGHPLDAVEIDSVIVLQDTADPRRGRHGVSSYADAPIYEVGRS
mgnify:CR=1 FL=1